jgi:hypothetical protein
MSLEIKNLPDAIRSVEANLRKALPNYAEVFHEVETEMRRKVAMIVKEREAGESVIPIVQYEEIAGGAVSPEVVASIKERGACVIRNVYSVAQAKAWDDEIGRYVEENHLDAKLANAAEDKYFGTLASAKPQIYGIYWSRPQVQARQGESLTRVRVFMNRLWKFESEGRVHFDPDQVPVYADRIRRRPPGSASLGLSPHVDGGLLNVGWTKTFVKFIGMCSQAIGATTILMTPPTGPRSRRFHLQLSAQCSVPIRAGLRSLGRVREMGHCN